MAGTHLLNLRVLASEDVDDYSLLRFDGREALSEPFDYRLELVCAQTVTQARDWIGQLVEFDVTNSNGDERVFAGRIYEVRQVASTGAAVPNIQLRVRPAYYATAYGRGTHFMQERTSREIFEALTLDVPGLTTDISLTSDVPKRSYTVRYDETELDFLDRVLAQDGIMYFFTYDRGAGTFRHKMHLADSASAYSDVPGVEDMIFQPGASGSTLKTLEHERRALAGKHDYHAFGVNTLDQPALNSGEISGDWGRVYPHSYEDLAGEVLLESDIDGRGRKHNEAYDQGSETISGTADSAAFFAGGRVDLDWTDIGSPQRVVLTSVTHVAYDPWMFGGQGGSTYSNSFTAMDAADSFRPPVPNRRRRAPGPVLGVVDNGSTEGEAIIDEKSRVPVRIAETVDYESAGLPSFVWLPVKQQWAHSTHGAQFFPRTGTRVVVDFLYGDTDLPFVAGTMYTPSQPYPFDPSSNATQSGWKSVTDKNGSITQNFLFEDKPGAEEIQLYTGRDYRRLIDNDDWGTIHHDQTLIVDNDQTETIKHDQKLNVENDQTITITNNRKIDVTGEEKTTIQKTRTTTVTQKSLLESYKEIELKVGPCSIQMTMSGITIKAPQITIKADATLQMSGGAMAELKAPMTTVSGDGMLTLKGGMVMIN